jgi:type II secretory pathway pseudopilin PulG
MGRLANLRLKLLQGQTGIGLLETLVAVAILGAVGVVFLRSMATAYTGVGITNEEQTAEILARSQLEEIKSTTYATNGVYPVTVTIPAQYSMNITAGSPSKIGTTSNFTSLDALMGYHVTTIQEITVSVNHGTKHIMSVACYKLQ